MSTVGVCLFYFVKKTNLRKIIDYNYYLFELSWLNDLFKLSNFFNINYICKMRLNTSNKEIYL